MKRSAICACTLMLFAMPVLAHGRYVRVAGGSFHSALRLDANAPAKVMVRPFRMRTEPVSNAEFLAFVEREPRWRRDRAVGLFASDGYLTAWQSPVALGAGRKPTGPVLWVSWFAARAYCASEGARLPRWMEWELVAAADATRRDARDDKAREAAILASLTSGFADSCAVPRHESGNVYGVRGMHALVAEWVDDYATMFVDTDARSPGDANLLRLCGGAAAAFVDRTDYALLMRVATLAALKPAESSGTVGFRCAKDDAPSERA